MGVLLLTLVATMTLFVAEPDRAHAQDAPSADATLDALIITGSPGNVEASMAPAFSDPTVTAYEARIPFITTGVAVTATATAANDGATIKVNGRDPTSGDEYIVPGLTAGRVNDVNIVVTAESGAKQTYTIKVYRERQTESDNANLSSLSISPGRLSPGFSASETSYNARVSAAEVTVSYRLSDTAGGASAEITAPTGANVVDGMDVTLAAEAAQDTATGGTTTITVTVTAEDGSTEDYSIEIYRIRANPDTNATLSDLDITAIPADGATDDNTIATDIEVDTMPVDGIDTEYKARVGTNVEMLTVAATADDAGAIVTLPRDQNANEPGNQVFLRKGALTTFTVNVRAEDPASTMTYTVEVYRNSDVDADLSEDADLTRLSLSAGALSPSFDSDTIGYEATVGSDVDKVTVSYRLSDTSGGADANVDTDTDGASVAGDEVTLAPSGDETEITVTVTPESGTTENQVYTITVYRTRVAPSADASLSALTVTEIIGTDLSPVFAPGPTGPRMYNATTLTGTGSVTVTAVPTATEFGATVDIDPASPVDLTVGETTTITITVTAEDGATTSEYIVNVYRQRAELSEDATLSALRVSGGPLSPAFMSDRVAYNARVGSDVDKVTVDFTPTDNAGGVNVAVSATQRDGTTDCEGGQATTCAVDGMEVTLDGSGSETIISLVVTPEAGLANNETYIVTVYRERRNLETEARLSASGFTITDNNPVAGTATPGPLNLLDDPTLDVGYRVRSVVVTATPMDSAGGAVATITAPPDNDPTTADHEIVLTAGAETMITVEVQAEDPAAPIQTYMAKVYRQNLTRSDDATLSSLMLSGVVLTPEFASDTMKYTGTAPYSTMMTTVSAMANHLGAQSGITITDDGMVDLTAGEKVDITVQVRPESVDVVINAGNNCAAAAAVRNEDIECYTITVTRGEELSSGATLQSLSLSGLTLTPAFDPATTMYTAEGEDGLATTMVVAMATSPGAAVVGTGEMDLVVGENTITITVTAENQTTETYTVVVTVVPGPTLIEMYDANANGQIEKDEALTAIDDYLFHERINKEQVLDIIDLYLFG